MVDKVKSNKISINKKLKHSDNNKTSTHTNGNNKGVNELELKEQPNKKNFEKIDLNELNEYSSDSEDDIDIENLTSNKISKTPKDFEGKKLFVILEHANLELSTGNKYEQKIISSEDNKIIRLMKKSKEDYRPDVTHHCLLSLMDSPLNKAGLLQVYIRTRNNVLIEINPKCRIPRTYNRFEGLFSVLLKKLSIRAKESSEILLRVIKNPITSHLPEGSYICSMNEKSRLVNKDEFAFNCDKSFKHVVLVIGAISKGDVEIDYNHDSISISSYPLSAGAVCSKVVDSFEKVWGIL